MGDAPEPRARDTRVLLLALTAGSAVALAAGLAAWGAGAALGLEGLRDVGDQVCGGASGLLGAGGAVSLSCLFNPGAGGAAAGGGGAAGGYGESDYDPTNPFPPGHRYSEHPAPGDRPYGEVPGPTPPPPPDPQTALNDPDFAQAQRDWAREHYVEPPPPPDYTLGDASGDVVMGVVRGMRGF